ncbi:MAG: class I tRNA ligase family protein [Patescibacteria group bacterium]|nr:class I tRNA ligase family protein [Patescibacteria group bacterium]
MKDYDHKEIENRWQRKWEESGIYQTKDEGKKYYTLVEFPYPSGEGLHTGHVRSYTAMDIVARKLRMEGRNVLYPMGWDAFGLPAENYAIKVGRDPQEITAENAANYRQQLKSLGLSFDWSREVNTTDPAYYKWTQWIFLQMFKKGLAYKEKTTINWCPSCKIGLANEEVVDSRCERCGGEVEKKEKEQWLLRITKYAQRLYDDLEKVDYIERAKTQQRNWIGPSQGATMKFKVQGSKSKGISKKEIEVFTTRPDTLFGATYVAVAPEHALIREYESAPRPEGEGGITNFDEVKKYLEEVKKKTDIERTAEDREKTGVKLEGFYAINPANQEQVPIFVADYVLPHYGTGAVMAVPAHDERDFEFAKKYDLPIKEVIRPVFGEPHKGAEFRRTITAIVRRPSDGKFLAVKWKKFGWLSLPIGGIDDGETSEEAATREVLEETGYQVKPIKKLGGEVVMHFFAENKDVWRHRLDQPVLLELVVDEPEARSAEEQDKLEPIWISGDELLNQVTHSHNVIGVRRFLGPEQAYIDEGELINSGQFDGLDSEEAKEEITKFVGGEMKTTYKLRDWIFSRQRYWGEPIPLVFCKDCAERFKKQDSGFKNEGEKTNPGWFAVPEDQLPVELPKVDKYEPTDTGESPLANIEEWVNTTCPQCGGAARRETDVMPNWAGSSWYYLRYCDPHNSKELASPDKLKYWTPIDWYNGGMEHTTLHLLYSRFWHKFLFDIGVVLADEPYAKRTSHGMILAEGGEKMSKSKGNVINPDSIVEKFGADTLRLYEMFIGPFDQSVVWSTDGIVGPRRFLEKVWRLGSGIQAPSTQENSRGFTLKGSDTDENSLESTPPLTVLHQLYGTIKKVTEDIEAMRFNTAVSALMILVGVMEKVEKIDQASWEIFLKLLAPLAPHITEELWNQLGHTDSIHLAPWPEADPQYLVSDSFTLVIQVNGVVRDSVEAQQDIDEVGAKELALRSQKIDKWLEDKEVKKVVYVPGRLINFVAL